MEDRDARGLEINQTGNAKSDWIKHRFRPKGYPYVENVYVGAASGRRPLAFLLTKDVEDCLSRALIAESTSIGCRFQFMEGARDMSYAGIATVQMVKQYVD